MKVLAIAGSAFPFVRGGIRVTKIHELFMEVYAYA